jgi:hypothetical protein
VKRFGRNQRRQMREQIAALSVTADALRKRTGEAEQRARHAEHELERWAADVQQLAGENSAYCYHMSQVGYDLRRSGPIIELAPRDYRGSRFDPFNGELRQARASIQALVLALQMDVERFPDRVMFKLVPHGTERFGREILPSYYALDIKTLRTMPPRAVEGFGRQIAEAIADLIRRDAK